MYDFRSMSPFGNLLKKFFSVYGVQNKKIFEVTSINSTIFK